MYTHGAFFLGRLVGGRGGFGLDGRWCEHEWFRCGASLYLLVVLCIEVFFLSHILAMVVGTLRSLYSFRAKTM